MRHSFFQVFEDGEFTTRCVFTVPTTEEERQFLLAGLGSALSTPNPFEFLCDQEGPDRVSVVDEDMVSHQATIGFMNDGGPLHIAFIRDDKPNLICVLTQFAPCKKVAYEIRP